MRLLTLVYFKFPHFQLGVFFFFNLRTVRARRSTYKLHASFKKLNSVQLYRVRLCLRTNSIRGILGYFLSEYTVRAYGSPFVFRRRENGINTAS